MHRKEIIIHPRLLYLSHMMQRGLISESDPLAGAVVDDDAAVDDDGKKELSSPKTIVEEIAKNGLQVTWH